MKTKLYLVLKKKIIALNKAVAKKESDKPNAEVQQTDDYASRIEYDKLCKSSRLFSALMKCVFTKEQTGKNKLNPIPKMTKLYSRDMYGGKAGNPAYVLDFTNKPIKTCRGPGGYDIKLKGFKSVSIKDTGAVFLVFTNKNDSIKIHYVNSNENLTFNENGWIYSLEKNKSIPKKHFFINWRPLNKYVT